jgi:hypothetical protein
MVGLKEKGKDCKKSIKPNPSSLTKDPEVLKESRACAFASSKIESR